MGPRVLVVEDNPVNLELVAALLESEGCRVIAAGTADVSLRLAATEQPDLILMDIQLPGMSGHDATRRLKSDPATAGIPVVALTAHAMRREEARAREAGCEAFLTKPIDTQAFRETLRHFLGERPRQPRCPVRADSGNRQGEDQCPLRERSNA